MCILSPQLISQVKRHEGYQRELPDGRCAAYEDNTQWSIGWGTRAESPDEIITREEAHVRLIAELEEAHGIVGELYPGVCDLFGSARRDALINMAYNLGKPNLQGFKRMNAAILNGEWRAVGIEALDSRWAKQVGHRAHELATQLDYGVYLGFTEQRLYWTAKLVDSIRASKEVHDA